MLPHLLAFDATPMAVGRFYTPAAWRWYFETLRVDGDGDLAHGFFLVLPRPPTRNRGPHSRL